MTLKTFHFAGVASMNITLGVPRYNIHKGCVSVKDPFSFDADPGYADPDPGSAQEKNFILIRIQVRNISLRFTDFSSCRKKSLIFCFLLFAYFYDKTG